MVHVILHETLETEPFAYVITELCVYVAAIVVIAAVAVTFFFMHRKGAHSSTVPFRQSSIGTKYCVECGIQLDARVKFCNRCGARQ